MYSQVTQFQGGKATLTAHQDSASRLLLLELLADEVEAGADQPEPPAQIAIVIDRSGSMGGQKLEITKQAVAKLIRSLRPEDRVALVAYDDQVQLITGLTAPTEALARKVEQILSGGSTNLYGGWVTAAKLVGPGGRVILLSDGLANVGRYTDARSLERHAGISYSRFQVSTTTIGVGDDYDEALMAGMAREGGGSHYFAQNTEAIIKAFSQERFAIGSVALSHVSIRYDGVTKELGHLWAGEAKSFAIPVTGLAAKPATLRFTTKQGRVETMELAMPADFGHSDQATLCLLKERAADLESQAERVCDPRSAQEVKETVRQVILLFLAHPMADTDLVKAICDSLKGMMERLDDLARNYDERAATIERKRMMQYGHNLRESHKSFSVFAEDRALLLTLHCDSLASMDHPLAVDPDAAKLADYGQWKAWMAVPLGLRGKALRVGVIDARDGFLLADMEKALGLKVRMKTVGNAEDILQALDSFYGVPR